MAVSLSQVQEALSGRYSIDREIGSGGMASVYLARDIKHNRQVAVKVLDPDLAQAVGVDRFLREIRTVANLSHPHILPLHDSGEADHLLFYVMPFAKGESLQDRLERERELPVEEAVRITCEIADALDHAHGEGVIHRDVKPANILLEAGHAVLTDFGLAQAIAAHDSDSGKLTQPGMSLGTPAYMSPEQAAGERHLDGRTDQYALACVLHEMLAGEPLFSGPSARRIIARQINEKPIKVRTLRPSVPDAVQKAILRALEKPAANRFQSVREFSKSIQEGMRESRSGGVASILNRAKPQILRFGVVAAVLVGLLMVLKPKDAALDDSLIICFPLASRGGEEFQGQDVALTISRSLETTGLLSCLDGWHYLTETQRRDIVSLTEGDARKIAEARGAGRFILGSVSVEGDSISATLALHDTHDGALLDQRSHAEHRAVASAGQVGVRAFMGFLPNLLDPGRPPPDLEFLAQRDQAAVATWIRGERLYRDLQFDSAYVLLREAVRIDSLLIPAALRGAQAASWAHHGTHTDTLVSLSVRHDSLLTGEQAHFAHGLWAHYSGMADTAVHRFRQALELRREWPEAWTALGETYFHLLPEKTDGFLPAEEAFRESIRLDPGFEPPMIHLTEIEVWHGNHDAADALLAQIRESRADSSTVLWLQLLTSCARNSTPLIPWAEAVAVDPGAAYNAAADLATGARYPVCAEAGLRAILEDPQDRPGASYSWGALMTLGGLLVALDRGEEAIEIWREAETSGTAGATPFLYLMAGAVSEPVSRQAARIDSMAQRMFGPEFERFRPIEGWSLGVWHSSQGNTPRLRLLAERMGTLAAGDSATALVSILNTALQGHVALARGDTTDAIDLLWSLRPAYPGNDLTYGIWEVLPYERLLLAQLLLAKNRFHDALDVAGAFDHPGPTAFLFFLPQSLAVRADAAAAMGWDDQAEVYKERLEGLRIR
ncbi:MAG: protein kinase [Gemmatimonadetes bacterium]|nr:protein kinase [Gemmatimonadota bacterium]